MSKITLRKEERAITLIQHLLDSTFTDKDGQPSHYIEFDTDARYELLTRSLRIQGLEDIDKIRNFTHSTIHSMKKRGVTGLDSFVATFEDLVQQYLDLPLKEFKIIFVLNAREREISQVVPFSFFDVRVELADWSDLTHTFDYEKWADHSYFGGITAKNELRSFAFIPLIASVSERGPDEAFQRANQVIHLFRAMLNLVQDFGRRKIGRSPLAEFLPSPSYGVFSATGTFETLYYTNQKYKYQPQSFDDEDITRFKHIIGRLREPTSETDTMSLVLDALDKYGRAIDAIEWHEAFLWFWQVLELITLQTENIRMDDVTARLKLIHKHDLLWSDQFAMLKEIRNALVHRGQFSNSGMHEVNFIKVAVENLIFWLVDATKTLPSRKQLEWFYAYAPRGDGDLEELQSFLGTLRELRKPKSKTQGEQK